MSLGLTEHGPRTGRGGRHAVVLSGGGARGAYEVGVLKALFEGASPATAGRPLAASIFTGTSVGAVNAAFLAQDEVVGMESVLGLERMWFERVAETPGSCGNGIFRLRADPTRFLEPGCLRHPFENFADLGRDALFWSGYALAYGGRFLRSDEPLRMRLLESFNLAALLSREPLERLLRDTIDLDRLRASSNALAVVTSDWLQGRSKVFRKSDITDRLGTDAILASTAIPGLFEPVDLDGTPCVDGGLLMNTPLKPALQEGADVLHVIYLDPTLDDIPFPPLPNTLDTFYRIYAILMATQINGDVGTTSTINHELAAHVRGIAQGWELPAVRARRELKSGRRAAAGPRAGEKSYKPLTIHRYRPKVEMGGAGTFLDFRSEFIASLISLGYEDAIHHDCGDSECVLPPLAPAPKERPS